MVSNYQKVAEYVIRVRTIKWKGLDKTYGPWQESHVIRGEKRVANFCNKRDYYNKLRWELEIEERIEIAEAIFCEKSLRSVEVWNEDTKQWDIVSMIDGEEQQATEEYTEVKQLSQENKDKLNSKLDKLKQLLKR